MKLLTHNMLMSPGTRNGYPLAIEVEQMEEVETDFNADFMARMVEKVDYPALLQTVASVRALQSRSRALVWDGTTVHVWWRCLTQLTRLLPALSSSMSSQSSPALCRRSLQRMSR
jgi:hypothetical protein